MATRIVPFQVSTPAGTTSSAYLVTPLSFQDGRVDRVEIIVPPGPSGLMGFKLAHSGQSVIPLSGDTWNVADGQRFDWPLSGFPTGDAWELWTYNTDVYDHSVYLWFHVTELAQNENIAPVPLDIIPLSDAED